MMKAYLLFVLFLFCSHLNVADPIDSLNTIINTEKNKLIVADALIQKARLTASHDVHAAKKLFYEARNFASDNKLYIKQVQANIALGRLYVRINDPDSALLIYNKGIDICNKNHIIKEKISCKGEIGSVYIYKNNYPLALESLFDALNELEFYENDTIEGNLLNNIAGVYYRMKEFEKATDYYVRSVTIKEKIKDLPGIMRTYSNLGNMYAETQMYDEALEYYRKSVEIGTKLEIWSSVAITYANMAGLYRETGDFENALHYGFEALKIDSSANDLYGMAADYNEIAFSFKELKQYNKAKNYMQKSLDIALQIEEIYLLSGIYKDFSILLSETGEYKDALAYYKLHTALEDSILNEAKNEQIIEAEKKFETEKKNVEIQALKIKNLKSETDKKVFIITAASLLVFALLLLHFYRQRDKVNKLLKHKNEQLKELNYTQNRLMSIISHDLKAPLSAFYSITHSLKTKINNIEPAETEKYFDRMLNSSIALKLQLENMLNWSLNQTKQIIVNKSNYNLHVLTYKVVMILQEFANEKNIELENIISEDIELETDSHLLSIVLNNLISNAVKFSNKDSKIIISAEKKDSGTIISVKDFGAGMSKEEIDNLFTGRSNILNKEGSGSGLGLIVCKDIVEKLEGDISVISELDKGSEFKIEL